MHHLLMNKDAVAHFVLEYESDPPHHFYSAIFNQKSSPAYLLPWERRYVDTSALKAHDDGQGRRCMLDDFLLHFDTTQVDKL